MEINFYCLGAIHEASHTLMESFNSNKSLQISTANLDKTKRDDALFNLFRNMVDSASLQSRDFAVQVDGCKGVLVWSNRSQLFSWPNTMQIFKYARRLGWTTALRTILKLKSTSPDKLRRKIMADYPKHIAIGFIGVLPHEQGKGVGTALVEHVLDKADQTHYPVYVEATDYQTVKFFERFGFVSQGQIALDKDQLITITPMVRQPVTMNEPISFLVRPGRRNSD